MRRADGVNAIAALPLEGPGRRAVFLVQFVRRDAFHRFYEVGAAECAWQGDQQMDMVFDAAEGRQITAVDMALLTDKRIDGFLDFPDQQRFTVPCRPDK